GGQPCRRPASGAHRRAGPGRAAGRGVACAGRSGAISTVRDGHGMSAVAPLPFRPEAVLFDMDGLMLDSERAINACMAQAARELGHDVPDTLWLRMIGGGDGLCRRLLAEQVGDAAGVALLAHAERLYDAVADAGIDHRPGVVRLLEWLVACDIPRAVATSTRRPLAMRKLAAAG